MKIHRLLSITKKEIIHIKRDRASLVIALLMPVMMLILFGFAVNTDVNNVKLIVYDGSRTQESRNLIHAFNNSYYFNIYGETSSPDEVEKDIDMGKTKVGLVILPDYAEKLKRNEKPEVQVLFDGSDPTIARTAVAYSITIANNYSTKIAGKSIENASMKSSGIDLRPLVLYNPSLESTKFNIPGVIGLILQNITVILTAFAMVRERERGTMEQLIMTPVTSFELICGKLIPYIVIGFFDMIVVLTVGYFVFGVDVKGSLATLIFLGTMFIISSLALGMLISTVAKTQMQAMQSAIIIILPSLLLSGFIFPRESMPLVIRFIGNLLPLTYFLEILRGIMVKGVGFGYLFMNSILPLLILIFIIVGSAMLKFKKTID